MAWTVGTRKYASFGEMIWDQRTKRGMRQQTLADALGVTRCQISNIEAGRSYMGFAMLEQTATTLGITIKVTP